MRVLSSKMVICWTFALASAFCIWFECDVILRTGTLVFPRSVLRGASFALVLFILSALAAIFGMAWWSLWKQKRHAKEWGIGASSLLFLVWTPFIYYGWSLFLKFEVAGWYIPAIGALGLLEFLWPSKKSAGGPIKARDEDR